MRGIFESKSKIVFLNTVSPFLDDERVTINTLEFANEISKHKTKPS